MESSFQIEIDLDPTYPGLSLILSLGCLQALFQSAAAINPLLHRLFLDHDIIFLFLDNIEKNQEKLSKVLKTFKYHEQWSICSKGAKHSFFFIIFSKALLWSKGLKVIFNYS